MKIIFKKESIDKIAKKIITKARLLKAKKATIIAFHGDLGSGKTTITKELGKQLGIQNNIVSPTFVLMKKYITKDNNFKNLIHIDAYRFEAENEVLVLGWNEMLLNKDNLIIVEWPNKIKKYIKGEYLNIELEHKDDTTRTIKFWYN